MDIYGHTQVWNNHGLAKYKTSMYVSCEISFNYHFFCADAERTGVAQSVQCLTTDWAAGVRSLADAKDFPLTSVSRPNLKPTQTPIQWVTVVLSPEVKRGRSVTLATHSI
jgi:hypothetical protein